jgi:hypothetical protein
MGIIRYNRPLFIESANSIVPILFWKEACRRISIDCFVSSYTNATRNALECTGAPWLIVVSMIPRHLRCWPRKKQSSKAASTTDVVHQQSTIEQDTTHFIASTSLTSSTHYIKRLWHIVMGMGVTAARLKAEIVLTALTVTRVRVVSLIQHDTE